MCDLYPQYHTRASTSYGTMQFLYSVWGHNQSTKRGRSSLSPSGNRSQQHAYDLGGSGTRTGWGLLGQGQTRLVGWCVIAITLQVCTWVRSSSQKLLFTTGE